jgi:lipopolysaccharide biosynthesis regulator YciM
MTSSITLRRLAAVTVIGAFLALGARGASAQSELNSELNSIESQMSGAMSSDAQAQSAVEKLDNAEKTFAQLSSSPKVNKAQLQPDYDRLESMLSRLHETYSKKKDDCIEQIDNGGQCDYTAPEQVALAAAYPLAWLRFQGASTIYTDQPERAKKLLNQAIDDFTQSSLAMPDPNLVRENVLGRAYCERELGKYDKNEYQKAIEDFKQIMSEGSGTQQYKAAQQGLATTYAAMGNANEAQKYSGGLGNTGGAELFKLQTTYAAMYAQPSKKAEYLKEIVDLARSKEGDKEGWAIAVSGIAKYSHNPVEELGGSGDPFQSHLLANVLLSKKNQSEAAKYYVEAAHSGKYPKDYKFAADIYFNEHNMGQVESILNDLSKSSSNPDAQWASYMRYKLPRGTWEASGMKNAQAQSAWLAAGDDYLKKYPHGEYSNEIRFREGEHLQEQKDYVNAAKIYQDVNGGEYGFAAKFNAAECEYVALVAASSKDNKDKSAAPANAADLRKSAMALLHETIKDAPEAERSAPTPTQKKYVRDTTGRAKYMLAGLIQSPNQTKQDAEDIAGLLNNFEPQYPGMNEKFQDVFEWRLQALNTLGRYDDIQRDLSAFLERNKGNSANSDLIKTLGIDFWKQAQVQQAAGDQKGYIQNAKLTETAYSYFEDMVAQKKMQPKNLTGTLSILGQAEMATGQEPKAEKIFQEVVKADAASPDANAGLARIAQSKHDLKDAVTLWTTVESTAAESDNQWYEAKYNIAEIYSEQGNVQGACSKLAQTRAEHPGLGSPEMAAKWNALQTKLCLNRQASN